MRSRACAVAQQDSLPQAPGPGSWSKSLTWGMAGNASLCQGSLIQQ